MGTVVNLPLLIVMDSSPHNLDASRIQMRGGLIQQAINFEFSGFGSYSHVGILVDAINGQQSNADMVNLLVRLCQYEGLPIVLNEVHAASNGWLNGYLNNARNLMNYMGFQGLGFPSSVHSVLPG
jgi:hypothetical protein